MIWLIVGILILFMMYGMIPYKKSTKQSLCNKELTDDEYIQHMIKHHEVAVYMSESQLHTKNPKILDILRNVIVSQKYEINLMKDSKILNNTNPELNDEMSNKNIEMDKSYHYSRGDYTKPNTSEISNTFCDPSFFEMSHKKIHHMTDEMYIQHMIPHHQVAVDMSKRILKTTKNDFIIDLSYKIIYNQQLEITKLHYLLNSKNMFESTIL